MILILKVAKKIKAAAFKLFFAIHGAQFWSSLYVQGLLGRLSAQPHSFLNLEFELSIGCGHNHVSSTSFGDGFKHLNII